MNKRLIFILTAILLCFIIALSACGENGTTVGQESTNENELEDEMTDTIFLTVGSHKVSVKLEQNSAVNALVELLKEGDISYTAHDYGGFEKVGALGHTLPREDEQMTTEAGDVILYINKGTVINYHNSACSYGAFDVYPNGVVNMAEGSKIVVDGASIDPTKPADSNYSNAMAFVVIGGGEVNVNGEIDLGLDNGTAYAFFIVNNYWYENPDADLPTQIVLDARCTIGAKAKIIATSSQEGGGVRFFAVQRNGSEEVTCEIENKKIKITSYGALNLKEGEESYSVFIENGATLTLNGEVATKSVSNFALTDSGYPGTGKANDHLGWFTSDAIKDMREFE